MLQLIEVSTERTNEFSKKGVSYCVSSKTLKVYSKSDDYRKKAKFFLAKQSEVNGWTVVKDMTEDGHQYIKEFENVDIDADEFNQLVDALSSWYSRLVEVYKESKKSK